MTQTSLNNNIMVRLHISQPSYMNQLSLFQRFQSQRSYFWDISVKASSFQPSAWAESVGPLPHLRKHAVHLVEGRSNN